MQYGVDVGRERVDDWDKLLIKEVTASVTQAKSVSVLEVGCGSGAQAVRLALAGARVTAIDVADYSTEVEAGASEAEVSGRISWHQAGIKEFLQKISNSEQFSYVSMQRVLHYLTYDDAVFVLKQLARITTQALYLSVTGTTTAIAKHHPCPQASWSERLQSLAPAGQQLFSITAPICPYSQDELRDLLEKTGWQIEKIRTSDFGNVKVVAIPTDKI